MRKTAILLAAVFLSACASTYNMRARAAHDAFHRGDYDEAIRLIDEVKPAPRDRLLHLLDRGMILHGAGRYKESNTALTEAEELSDWLSARSITKEVAATLWSEEARGYPGERYERVLIPVIRMLNYIMQDEWDEALVEVRRISILAEKVYGKIDEYDNEFAIYLSAVVWETLGHINDALIDYKRLGKGGEDLPYLGHDIKETSRRLALHANLPPKESLAWEAPEGYRRDKGELIVIAEAGRSPYFFSESVSTGLFTLSMPEVMGYAPSVERADVIIDGREAGRTYRFYNIADDIFDALKDRRKRSFVRKMIKTSVQTGLYAAGAELSDKDDTKAKIAGVLLVLLGFSMSAADTAEERSWRTLPADFQLARFYLKPGRHKIEIVPEGGGAPIEETVDVGKERPKVLLAHFPEGAPVARRMSAPEPGGAAKARERERALVDDVKKRPRDGTIKLALALARIGRGDYNVEGLVKSAMKEGGDRQRAIEALVIVSMVKGDYNEAREWAQRAMSEKAGGEERFKFYADAASYLTDKKAVPPESPSPSAGAFDHFVIGLIDEKSGKYDDATREFAAAYKSGLVGEPVAKKVMEGFKKAGDDFKKSDEGIEIVSDFADSYLPQISQ